MYYMQQKSYENQIIKQTSQKKIVDFTTIKADLGRSFGMITVT